MDDDLWRHSETDFRRTLLGLLERIAEALEAQVQRSSEFDIGDLSPEEAATLSRGFADLNAGNLQPYVARSR